MLLIEELSRLANLSFGRLLAVQSLIWNSLIIRSLVHLSMSASNSQPTHDNRPEYMIALGLAPPYTHEDVMQAYRTKVMKVHPDHGGSVEEFRVLQEAFEKAKEYTDFRNDRRQWIASQMERYLAVQRVFDRLQALGAEVKTNAVDWLEKSFGDFAQLTETITSVTLNNSARVADLLAVMVEEREALESLTELNLSGCQLNDGTAQYLDTFKQLKHLDLSNNPITSDALYIVDELPALESLNLDGTNVGWWTKRKVRKLMQHRHDSKPVTPFDS